MATTLSFETHSCPRAQPAAAPPLFRALLSGGHARSRWGTLALAALGGLIGLCVPLVARLVLRLADWPLPSPPLLTVAGCALTAAVLSWLADRWLSPRHGRLTAVAWSLGPGALGIVPLCGIGLALTLSLALSGFALGNVGGVRPWYDTRGARTLFFASAGAGLVWCGPAAPLLAFSIAGLSLALAVDSRGIRFLLDPFGWTVFLACIPLRMLAVHWTHDLPLGVPSGEFSASLEMLRVQALAALPMLPFAGYAFVRLLRQGHHATPIWRLAGCWWLSGMALAIVGVVKPGEHAAALLPPLALLAAEGMHRAIVLWRRQW